MRYIFFILFLFGNFTIDAQPSDKINEKVDWTGLVNWNEVIDQAKKAGKYIFIDCYATWCVPCKMMDSLVFKERDVVKSLNSKFINLRVQMDSTKKDNEDVAKKYPIAKMISSMYGVSIMPTYLVFNSSGTLVDKHFGAVFKHTEFNLLVNQSSDVSYQYYTLLTQFEKGTLSELLMKRLLKRAILLGDKNNYIKIADTISVKYNAALSADDYKDLISATINMSQPSFDLINSRREEINSVCGEFTGDLAIINLWIKELNNKYSIKTSTVVNWNLVKSELTNAYSNLREGILIKLKMINTKAKKEWNRYSNSAIDYCQLYFVSDQPITINNIMWEIFEKCDQKNILKRAIKVADRLLRNKNGEFDSPVQLDTYSNLLYKAGYHKKAIRFEQYSIKLAKETNQGESVEVNSNTLEKMLKGQATWPEN